MVNTRPAIKHIALVGLCAALMTAAQVVMSGLPNIEPVTLLVILFTQHFKKQTPYIIYIFVVLQGQLYGFHMWWFSYLYIWAILYFAVLAIGPLNSAFGWALIAAIYGLLFGAMSSIPYWFTMGPAGAAAWILSGFYFDLLHCGGNFVMVLLLWKPLHIALEVIARRWLRATPQ